MGAFRYQAIDANGRTVDGELSAPTRVGALAELSSRGLVPVQLGDAPAANDTTAKAPGNARGGWLAKLRQPRFGATHLVQTTQALGSLVRAGLTVDRALAIATHLSTDLAPRAFLEDVAKRVRAGATFADSVAASGRPLPGYYVSMVAAGEAGGALASTLLRLAELLKRQQAIRQRVTSALVYPAILVSVVVLTLIVLVGFVLPRFEQLFIESEAPLPLATRLVLAFGRFVADYGLALAIVGALGVTMTIRWLRDDRGRRTFHTWLLRSRWLLGLPASIDTARLLRTLSTLIGNGLTLPAALKVARGTLSNDALRAALDGVAQRVKAGEPLNVALAASTLFPPVAAQLARVGEETGKLDEMLLSAAEYLEEHSTTTLDRLLTLLVPALTVGMGLVVAGLIGSVLVGLLSINDLAY
ncbi:MAG TPA: type II secretion system F family protein [Steroidobacteraceae bacterium]|nr:type II secretion system F family protein [Steroidobacteraceae bacterium]